jgi:hypothetical protein
VVVSGTNVFLSILKIIKFEWFNFEINQSSNELKRPMEKTDEDGAVGGAKDMVSFLPSQITLHRVTLI